MLHPRPAPRPRRLAASLLLPPLLLIGGALVGCGNKTSDRDIVWVTPEEARQAMTQRRGPVGLGGVTDGAWIDPRIESEFLKGHIPDAVHIPFAQLDALFPAVRNRQLLIVYGTDFGDTIAAAASKRFIELGHRDVRTLRGGLRAWTQDGGEVKSGRPAPDS